MTIKCIFKILLATLAFAVVKSLWGHLIWGGIFKAETMAHAAIWRPEDSPFWSIGMPLGALLVGFCTVVAYGFFHTALCTTCWVRRGLQFGFIMFIVAGLGYMSYWYVYTPVSLTLLFAAHLDVLVSNLVGGVLISLIIGCKTCNKTSA